MASEKRLIDANALLEEIQRIRKAYKKISTFTTHNVIACIKIAPTVDAAEVVRCKDCKYRHDSCFAGNGNTYCDYHHKYFPLDGFCSYGERKKEE